MFSSILVVDDSPLSRKLVIRALPPEWQAEVVQAGNGQEALAVLASRPCDLVLLDLNMPVMDGYEFLQALEGRTDRPTVIVLSGDIQPLAQARVRALGARAFVKKPLVAEHIRAALAEPQS
jgi:CheY-like chemotaxis protein